MKKRFSLLLLSMILVATVLLTACGGGNNVDVSGSNGKDVDTNAPIGQDGVIRRPHKAIDLEDVSVIEFPKVQSNPSESKSKDTITYGMNSLAWNFQPLFASSVDDVGVVLQVFDTLTTLNHNGETVPHVAKDWEVFNDGKSVRFLLRDDVYFTDGEQLTAKDVEFSYTMMCDPSYTGRYGDLQKRLVGGEKYHNGEADKVEGLEVEDDFTIVFHFNEVDVTNVMLSHAIMPSHYYAYEKGNVHAEMTDRMHDLMGSGPYKYVRLEANQFVEFEANENYFLGAPFIPRMIFAQIPGDTAIQEMETGGVDIMARSSAREDTYVQYEGMGFVDFIQYPSNSYNHLTFNNKDVLLQDINIRKAIAWATDRQGMIDLYNGRDNAILINVPFSNVSWVVTDKLMNETDYYQHSEEEGGRQADIAKAKEFIEASGYKLNSNNVYEKDGKELAIELMATPDSTYYNDILIPMLSKNFEEVGIKLVPDLMEWASMQEKFSITKDFQLVCFTWTLTSDPASTKLTFHSDADRPGGNNTQRWSNDRVDYLLTEANKEFDQNKRIELYEEFAFIFNEEMPMLPLYQPLEWIVINNRVDTDSVQSSPFVPIRLVTRLVKFAD